MLSMASSALLKQQRPAAATPRQEVIRHLLERVEALQREIDAENERATAAAAALRHAETRERDLEAELRAMARTAEMQGEKLRGMEEELRYKEGRIKVLEAIFATMTKSNKNKR
ncbi:hypothetical protein BS78_03G013700 [Paspalum vaginatum]|nr:hypothetical protein BS78_03G013700 [Paspalum vaginatum]